MKPTSTAERMRAALPAIFVAHAVKTLCAIALLGELGGALLGASQGGARSTGSAWLIALGLGAHPRWTTSAQWVVVLYLFLSPLLTQLVLAALSAPGTLAGQLRAALARYRPALALGAGGLCTLALLSMGASVGAEQLPALVATGAALEESVRAAVLVLALLSALFCATAFDLAAARLAHERTSILRALRGGMRAVAPGPCAMHGSFVALATILYALGDLSVRDAAWPLLALATQQSLALASALVRAAWLTQALARTA